MRNEVIFDSRGIPDIMVVFTPDELGLPAEIRGKAVKEYAISKYPNTLIGGVPYSMPYQQPAVNVNHDEAIRLCESKGPGWHLITNDEWAALAHQSRKNGTLPRGNTDCGKSHSHPEETGTTYKDSSGSSKTLTGSGPVTWNHDHTAEGVADMCGNIWEHVGGIRFVNGQVQVIPNNEAAAGADQSKDSKEWTPLYIHAEIVITTGRLVSVVCVLQPEAVEHGLLHCFVIAVIIRVMLYNESHGLVPHFLRDALCHGVLRLACQRIYLRARVRLRLCCGRLRLCRGACLSGRLRARSPRRLIAALIPSDSSGQHQNHNNANNNPFLFAVFSLARPGFFL